MTAYAIILNEPNNAVWERVRANWPSCFIVSETMALISSPDPTVLTSQIAEAAGMNGNEKVLGVVLQVGNYFGYNSTALWEWLGKSHE